MGCLVVPNSSLDAPKTLVPAYPGMQSATAIADAGGGGGHDSESEIIRKHDRLIRYRAIPFVGHGVDVQDLIQEGRIALLEAARKFDESHGASLWTYARKFVLGAMFKCVSREIVEPSRDLASRHDGDDEELPLYGGATGPENLEFALASGTPSPEEIVELEEDLAILEEEVATLSEAEKSVLWKVFGEEKSLRDVAVESGCHHCTPQRVYHGAMQKLRHQMEART